MISWTVVQQVMTRTPPDGPYWRRQKASSAGGAGRVLLGAGSQSLNH